MKKQRQFPFGADSLKHSRLGLQSLILVGIMFFSLTSISCSTTRLQLNELTQKKSVLPHDMRSPSEDADIVKESSCIITVNDDGGTFLMGKDQVSNDRITERVVEKLKGKSPDKRIVYLEVAASVRYGTVILLLNLIRKADIDKVGLVVDKIDNQRAGARPTMFEVKLPPEPDVSDEMVLRRPNPLTLVVEIDKTGALMLNKEPMGKVDDTTSLTGKLSLVFKERENNGVFREATNEVEKTVFVKAPRSIKYADVVKIIDALKIAGAQPIGLQIDDLND